MVVVFTPKPPCYFFLGRALKDAGRDGSNCCSGGCPGSGGGGSAVAEFFEVDSGASAEVLCAIGLT